MSRLDRFLLIFLASGFWALFLWLLFSPKPAISQDFYFEVQEAVNNCAVYGRVRQDFYGAHRLEGRIDCGPTWVGEGEE